MKKQIIFKVLALIFGASLIGCELGELDLTPTPDYRYVNGVVRERDSGEKLKGIKIEAYECKFCLISCEPEYYGPVTSGEDGTFYFRYFGPSSFNIYPILNNDPHGYGHYSVNGIDRDSVTFMPCVKCNKDTAYVDIKVW